jgi:hypothetical protein
MLPLREGYGRNHGSATLKALNSHNCSPNSFSLPTGRFRSSEQTNPLQLSTATAPGSRLVDHLGPHQTLRLVVAETELRQNFEAVLTDAG